MDEETPRPSIDLDSPPTDRSLRGKELKKILVTRGKADDILKRFRNRQRVLLETDNIEDPYPFEPTYIFFCFTGNRTD